MSDSIVYANTDNRTIYLSDDIDNKSVGWINYKLIEMISKDDDEDDKQKSYERKPIKLYINSCGGYIRDMWSTIDIILNSKTPIHTYCTGYAYSSGLQIFIAGHKRYATKHAEFLYHQLANGISGKYKDLEESFEHSSKQQKQIELYMIERTKITQERLDDVREMKFDWYISANEALELGIIDEIIDNKGE